MTRNLKTFGLVVVAGLSMSAALAPAAQGETGEFAAPTYPATITGTQIGAPATWGFGTSGVTVRTLSCTVMTLHGSISQPSDPITLSASHSGCSASPGGLPATMTTNGCDYTLSATAPGTTGHAAGTGTVSTVIDCPPGQKMEAHIFENAAKHAEGKSLCTYDIGPQGPISAGTYHNRISDMEATIEAKFTALSTIGPKILCGAAANTHLIATLKGTFTLQAHGGGGELITLGAQ